MIRLYLLRHAEAADSRGADIDRVLTPHGREQARAVGDWFGGWAIPPTIGFYSPAVRTKQTFLAATDNVPGLKGIESPAIYNAGPDTLAAIVRDIDDAYGAALVVGHNPGTSQLAAMLAGDGPDAMIDDLAQGFSPASLAVLEFDGAWADVKAGSGFLRAFVRQD